MFLIATFLVNIGDFHQKSHEVGLRRMGGNSLWLVNRPLRIRTMGGVGAVGEKPTATRLDHFLINYEVIFYFTLTPIITIFSMSINL